MTSDQPRDAGEGTIRLEVRSKRIYAEPEPVDGYRVLIDHVWPRGVSRERANLDEWAREPRRHHPGPLCRERVRGGRDPQVDDGGRRGHRASLAGRALQLASTTPRFGRSIWTPRPHASPKPGDIQPNQPVVLASDLSRRSADLRHFSLQTDAFLRLLKIVVSRVRVRVSPSLESLASVPGPGTSSRRFVRLLSASGLRAAEQ
jgi:hypothetical protein